MKQKASLSINWLSSNPTFYLSSSLLGGITGFLLLICLALILYICKHKKIYICNEEKSSTAPRRSRSLTAAPADGAAAGGRLLYGSPRCDTGVGGVGGVGVNGGAISSFSSVLANGENYNQRTPRENLNDNERAEDATMPMSSLIPTGKTGGLGEDGRLGKGGYGSLGECSDGIGRIVG